MEPITLTDQELLTLIVGPKTATKIYSGRLTPLMLGENGLSPNPKLAASFELSRRLMKEALCRGPLLKSPQETSEFLIAHFLGRPSEAFVAIFLDNRHRVITVEEMFQGTISGAQVHPREVVRSALRCNAAACIFAHNHPSGVAEPSSCDKALTQSLITTLALVEVRVLDHIVVAGGITVSFAERGML